MAFTDAEKLAEIDREMQLRHRVYKWQIRSGKLTQDQAARQIALLTAIRMDYAQKVKRAEPIGPLFA
ncbi:MULTISPECIES: hypothetical protein [unclassified Bradyrhizobium]|uniref:hypothetical protein n=1 Tax=unclassified Bradyrhizobium TaxID=2631580 RepID=UPI002916086A|nr:MULTISPECIES: hypothetical protein [unclassified Bradyrhizobium]